MMMMMVVVVVVVTIMKAVTTPSQLWDITVTMKSRQSKNKNSLPLT
jgi:hypothetical protein